MTNKKEHIIDLLEKNTIMTVSELSQELSCSEMTIRRYLNELAEKGFVVRGHGHAYLNPDAKPTMYDEQMQVNKREKIAIAHEAIKFISQGNVVNFDSGTTIQRLAEMLDDDLVISAITPSLTVARELANHKNISIMMPEGQLNHNNLTLEILAQDEMPEITADIAFLSCRALKLPVGTYEHTNSLIATKQYLAKTAKKRILLVDSSKWNINSIVKCLPLLDFDVIITDENVLDKNVNLVKNFDVEVIVASL
jgi:DeoR/GlpR family transcriptional regulator of sugar metabolism